MSHHRLSLPVLLFPILLLAGCMTETQRTTVVTEVVWPEEPPPIATVSVTGWTRLDRLALQDWLSIETHDPVGLQQLADLDYLREALRMNHDLAETFGPHWGDADWYALGVALDSLGLGVVDVLDHYGFGDPAAGLPAGRYAEPVIQTDYDRLVDLGRLSDLDALYAMQEAQELLLLDLEAAAARTVDHIPLTSLYRVLLAATRNHLRALDDWMQARGIVYAPLYLTRAEYLAVVTAPLEQPVW